MWACCLSVDHWTFCSLWLFSVTHLLPPFGFDLNSGRHIYASRLAFIMPPHDPTVILMLFAPLYRLGLWSEFREEKTEIAAMRVHSDALGSFLLPLWIIHTRAFLFPLSLLLSVKPSILMFSLTPHVSPLHAWPHVGSHELDPLDPVCRETGPKPSVVGENVFHLYLFLNLSGWRDHERRDRSAEWCLLQAEGAEETLDAGEGGAGGSEGRRSGIQWGADAIHWWCFNPLKPTNVINSV